MRSPAPERLRRAPLCLRLLCALVFCLLVRSVAAQQVAPPAPLTGIVKTSEGTLVPGAAVRLINTETNKVWLSWTDDSGKFEFPQIAPGQYRIETNQLGFTQTSLTIQVPVVPAGAIPIVVRVATLAERPASPRQTRTEPLPAETATTTAKTTTRKATVRTVAEKPVAAVKCQPVSPTQFAKASLEAASNKPT
jgi:hypothetical protein